MRPMDVHRPLSRKAYKQTVRQSNDRVRIFNTAPDKNEYQECQVADEQPQVIL